MKCPECDKEIDYEHTYMNGEPITIYKCECGYMRIKDEHI